jgi:CSLREA domain-containing protein
MLTPEEAHGATFLVTSDLDNDDGNCTAGHCTLREAINAANANGGPDTITFYPPVTFIAVSGSLPAITSPLTIDGPGYSSAPFVEVNGASGGNAFEASAMVHINDLSITGFSQGIILNPSSNGSTVTHNWIGVRPNGTADGNTYGVHAYSGSTIGGTAPAERNVISANIVGILVQGADGVVIQGNYIGTNPAGTASVGSQSLGILWADPGTNRVIGGTTAGARNVISGNTNAGISSTSLPAADGWSVIGNYIGLNATGTAPIPNGVGIRVSQGSDINIGGPTASERNIISGNSDAGIELSSPGSGILVQNNFIGTGPDRTSQLGNGSGGLGQGGIAVTAGSPTIQQNVIAYSGGDGIYVTGTTTDAEIIGNEFILNDGLAVDLGNNGVTANDAGDGDTGPNTLQNFPTVTSATTSPTGTSVTLNIQTGGPIGAALFTVYASASCDSSGNGEGERYVGAALAVISGPSINLNVNLTTPVTPGARLTAQVAFLGSSEFSPCFTVPACSSPSTDCDGFNDAAATSHTGPANASTSVDNCNALWNQPQLNTDGNFIDNDPYATDDKTWIRSDAQGDDCDADADNDGLDDGEEGGLPYGICPAATGPTNPLLRDTDGDRFLDGAECNLGFDPVDAASKPALSACGSSADTDGDRIADRIEVCNYNSNPNSNDSDGDVALDGAKDGCEVASINADRVVNAGDQLLLSQEIVRIPPPAKLVNFDLNKDGAVNAGDQLLMSFFVSPPGQCP